MDIKAVWFKHDGLKFVGTLGRPDVKRARKVPGVLVLHGFPGAEKNVDIVRALLQRGIAAYSLHARGAWGSDGEYAFRHLVADAKLGLDYLAAREGVDTKRLGVLGYSMGGWTALHLAAGEPRLKCVAAIAPVGSHGARTVPESREFILRSCGVLRVNDAEALADDFFSTVRPADPVQAVRRTPRPLLLVHGDKDPLIPLSVSQDIAEASAGKSKLVVMKGAEHHFLPQREKLVKLTADWIKKQL